MTDFSSRLLTRWRALVLFLVLALSLVGCSKNVPIEDDQDAQSMAIEVMTEYLNVLFETQDRDYLQARTAVPFWVNSRAFESLDQLLDDLTNSEMGRATDLQLEVLSAKFHTLDDLKERNAKVWAKLEERNLTGNNIYAIQVAVEMRADEFGSDKDDGWVIMHMGDDGLWRIHGLQ